MTTTPISFDLANLSGGDKTPLYLRYPAQINPQPAYVHLTSDGQVSAYVSGEIGNGTPARIWNSVDLQWPVSCEAHPVLLAKLLQGDALPLLERIHAGHAVEWDGSNYRGELTDDASEASDELAQLLEEGFADPDQRVSVWTAGDWLFSSCTLFDHWHGASLADAVKKIQDEAEVEGVVIDGDVSEALLDAAMRNLDHEHEGLDENHFSALIASGHRTEADVNAYREAVAG